MKRFFFITTFDNISAKIVSSIINSHPDIKCLYQDTNSLLPVESNDTIDEIIMSNKSNEAKFVGNIQNFTAYDLQHRVISEKTKTPFKKINITMSPLLRIRLILNAWKKSGINPEDIIDYFEKEASKVSEKNSLLNRHKLFYFYSGILLSIFNSLRPYIKILNENPAAFNAKKLPNLKTPQNKLFIMALALTLTFDSADLPCSMKKINFESLLTNEDEVKKMIAYLTNNEAVISDDFHKKYQASIQEIYQIINEAQQDPWDEWQFNLINEFINKRLETVYHPHIDKPLTHFYSKAGYNFTDTTAAPYSKLISIQLNSNRPAQLSAYFDNIEETADNPKDIEVLVNIDIGDETMKSLLDIERLRRKFTLKYICTSRPKSLCELWKPLNNLYDITDPRAYFLLNVSDEMFFITKGWDTLLKNYVGYFPDHLFRLRASRNKLRNYYDRWECSFAQDSIPITTKKWIDIGGDWNPCFGPDSFQQLVAFYLTKEGAFSNYNMQREIPILDIQFAGDIPSVGLTHEKAWKLHSESIRAMQICQSHKMQQEARRRAMLILAHIFAYTKGYQNVEITDIKKKKLVLIKSNDVIANKISYKLSWLAITLENQWRKLNFHYYFGSKLDYKPNRFVGFMNYLSAKYKIIYIIWHGIRRIYYTIYHMIRRFIFFWIFLPSNMYKIIFKRSALKNRALQSNEAT